MYIKIKLLCLCILLAPYGVAVSSEYQLALNAVDYDIPPLQRYCQGAFYICANQRSDIAPSHVCRCTIARETSQTLNFHYYSPAYYVNTLLVHRYQRMDADFYAQLRKCGDRHRAWIWFAYEYFPREVISPAARDYLFVHAAVEKMREASWGG